MRIAVILIFLVVTALSHPQVAAATLVANGNGTVSDTRTGLIWQQGEPGAMTWGNAITYCEGLTLGGNSDWRLPNVKELESLTDDTRYNPSIDKLVFPNANASNYWSSATYAGDPNYAWDVDFGNGRVNGRYKYYYNYVRCVRGGQSGSFGSFDYFTVTAPDGVSAIGPQAVGTVFPIKITAKDAQGNVGYGYSGYVNLVAFGGLWPMYAYISNGGWQGDVRVYEVSSATRIEVSGGGGSGASEPFVVSGVGTALGSLKGHVNSNFGTPVIGAMVYLSQTRAGASVYSAKTDQAGSYSFTNNASGAYYLWAESNGVTSAGRKSVTIPAGRPANPLSLILDLSTSTDIPVVLVPGIMGSNSTDIRADSINPEFFQTTYYDPENLRLHDPAKGGGWFNNSPGWRDLTQLLMNRVKTVPAPWDWRMAIGLDVKEKDCRDTDPVCKYLIPAIDRALKDNPTGKVNIIAHSMGGLLVRAYLQSELYLTRNDVANFSMVGTPNKGSTKAYYLWEGGDPHKVDELEVDYGLNFYWESTESLWSDAGYADAKGKGTLWSWQTDKIQPFLQKNVKTIRQLLPTYDFLNGGGVTGDNVNDLLPDLNKDPLRYERMGPPGSTGKVITRVYFSDDQETVKDITSQVRSYPLYVDGVPLTETKPKDSGDGTVLAEESAKFPCSDTAHGRWADCFNTPGAHSSLIRNNLALTDKKRSIVYALYPNLPDKVVARTALAAATVPASSLVLTFKGRIMPSIINPQGLELGVNRATGAVVEDIPGGSIVNSASVASLSLENPADGVYTIYLKALYSEDYAASLEYVDSDGALVKGRFSGFNNADIVTFTVTIASASANKITITHVPQAPLNLLADAVGTTELTTKLTWQATGEAGVAKYGVYCRQSDEPYFSKLGDTTGTTFDTVHPWAKDDTVMTRIYAVTAINTDGSESFFSSQASNDDRDHDGLTDVEEAALGTDPTKEDTDGDGYSDALEVQRGSSPLDKLSVPKTWLSVTFSGSGGGRITSDPAGINCTYPPTGGVCGWDFPMNSTVKLLTAPDNDSLFVTWSGACTDTLQPCTVVMTEPKSVNATIDVSTTTRTNVALAASGGVATASSAYSALYGTTAVNDGDRLGKNWGVSAGGGGWNDATTTFPDWAQITFNGQKSIEEIDVVTLQDAYATASEPTATLAFTKYGITAFDVQYWNGTTWVTVPGGSITGNNLVWRKITFPVVTTDQIRVLVNAGLAVYSRIVEIEAYTAGGGIVNNPPTVTLTAPANGATFTAPATISLTATAADSDGTISKVEFYNGATLLGTDTTAPYSYTWTSVAAGSYTLTAKAYDNLNAATTSTAATVTVAPANVPPTVTLTAPANGATFTAPATISLTATAADSDGTISKVEFYNGATLLGTDTTAPYSYTWTSVAAGSYTLTAKAYDNLNAATTSTAATVTVTVPAVRTNVALVTNGGVATASSTNSVIYTVTAVNDGDRLGKKCGVTAAGGGWNDATNTAYPDWAQITFNGQKTIDEIDVITLQDAYATAIEPTATLAFTKYGITAFDVQYWNGSIWVTVPGGSITGNNLVWRKITFPAVTTDRIRVQVNAGIAGTYNYSRIVEIEAYTTSGAVVNNPPTVALTAPATGATFTASATINLTATAADSDGTINKVEFHNGATLLGTDTTAPYSYTWTGVAAGSYTLTAKAYDNVGAVTTSTAATVTVSAPANVPPTVALTSPATGATFTAPATISLMVTAADSDGTVSKVEFYNGATLLGTATTAPYSYTWTSVTAGSYTLTAKAYDNLNAVTTSTAATVTVTVPAVRTNVALVTNGGVATASSTNSVIYTVTAVNDGDRLGKKWGVTAAGGGWNDATNNVFPDWAQITFNGQKTINEIDVITLQDAYATAIEPTATLPFTKYGIAAFDVQYWNGSTWVTVPGGSITGNNLVWRKITFPAVTTDRIRVQVNASLAGYSRIVEIEAFTTGGAVVNNPPTVTLTAPANGATFIAPATISLTATAADSDGTISKVEFYNGATLLGTSTAAPYTYSWGSVSAGSYTLTAKAYDNLNAATTSTAVSVTVNASRINVALQSNGGVSTVSSTYSATTYPSASMNNGDRKGLNWGSGGGWNDATNNVYPDWAQITFNGQKNITEIDVFTLQDAYATPIEPTAAQTITIYGITAFDVQYWNGTGWVTVSGGSVTGNNLVWRKITFPAVTTDRIRVLVNASFGGYSRITEIEAY